ncbi:MAG: hypothetical protein H6654_11920 [Ardenticatenaceae bacterium]|nr:hypothetical protein [Anaerolineales bacterium]MCB8937688.1 hypothetical protein [Ardenticatenaceae bacterium]MCB8974257.1 hypothetical protein [Ardenticatenaceae bacterium]
MSDQSPTRCAATTKAGNPCKNWAAEGSDYCRVHQNEAPAAPAMSAAEADLLTRKKELLAELDELVADLKTAVSSQTASPYNPLNLLTYLRQNLSQFTPEMQLGILQQFEGMTREDLMDIETWKGMGYMLSYSAKFQANQLREKMNEQLPKPLQPDTMLNFVKTNIDRFTPDVAKGIMDSLQGATREDLMDPETWKGLWYMINYSVQFQAEQWKQKLTGETEEE